MQDTFTTFMKSHISEDLIQTLKHTCYIITVFSEGSKWNEGTSGVPQHHSDVEEMRATNNRGSEMYVMVDESNNSTLTLSLENNKDYSNSLIPLAACIKASFPCYNSVKG